MAAGAGARECGVGAGCSGNGPVFRWVHGHGRLVHRPQVPVHAHRRRPGDHYREGPTRMKSGIHPEYKTTEVICSCGNTFMTRSTAKNGQIHVETCSACHPFYTGKQRVRDTAGRVAKFQAKYAKVNAGKKK